MLFWGEGILEYAFDQMRNDYAWGSPSGTPQLLQQSLFIVRRAGIPAFLDAMARIPDSDARISPETKFARVRYDWLPERFAYGGLARFLRRKTHARWYDWLPFGYGRTRPIDWEGPRFYFQHGTLEELQRYRNLTGIRIDDLTERGDLAPRETP